MKRLSLRLFLGLGLFALLGASAAGCGYYESDYHYRSRGDCYDDSYLLVGYRHHGGYRRHHHHHHYHRPRYHHHGGHWGHRGGRHYRHCD